MIENDILTISVLLVRYGTLWHMALPSHRRRTSGKTALAQGSPIARLAVSAIPPGILEVSKYSVTIRTTTSQQVTRLLRIRSSLWIYTRVANNVFMNPLGLLSPEHYYVTTSTLTFFYFYSYHNYHDSRLGRLTKLGLLFTPLDIGLDIASNKYRKKLLKLRVLLNLPSINKIELKTKVMVSHSLIYKFAFYKISCL